MSSYQMSYRIKSSVTKHLFIKFQKTYEKNILKLKRRLQVNITIQIQKKNWSLPTWCILKKSKANYQYKKAFLKVWKDIMSAHLACISHLNEPHDQSGREHELPQSQLHLQLLQCTCEHLSSNHFGQTPSKNRKKSFMSIKLLYA